MFSFVPGIPGARRPAVTGPQGRYRPPPRCAQRLRAGTGSADRPARDQRVRPDGDHQRRRQAAGASGGRRGDPPGRRRRPGCRADRASADSRPPPPARCRSFATRSPRSATSSRRWHGPRPIRARCRTTWRRRSARSGCSRRERSGWSASRPARCSCATRSTRPVSKRSSSPAANTSRPQTFSRRTATPMPTARRTAGCWTACTARCGRRSPSPGTSSPPRLTSWPTRRRCCATTPSPDGWSTGSASATRPTRGSVNSLARRVFRRRPATPTVIPTHRRGCICRATPRRPRPGPGRRCRRSPAASPSRRSPS